MPLGAAYGWFILLNLWLAGLFMAGYLRALGINRAGAGLAGLGLSALGLPDRQRRLSHDRGCGRLAAADPVDD